jgi:hypothetical protein
VGQSIRSLFRTRTQRRPASKVSTFLQIAQLRLAGFGQVFDGRKRESQRRGSEPGRWSRHVLSGRVIQGHCGGTRHRVLLGEWAAQNIGIILQLNYAMLYLRKYVIFYDMNYSLENLIKLKRRKNLYMGHSFNKLLF